MSLKGISRADLCKATEIPYTTLANWLQAKRYPRPEHLAVVAKYLGVSTTDLIGEKDSSHPETKSESPLPDNITPMPKTYKIPLLSTIACGEPILAAENIEDEVEIPEHIHADFALRCKGDSMINARIHDGDIVYIRQQPAVNNGEIAAVLIGDEATLKRVYVHSDHVVLQPENPSFDPLVYFGEAMEQIRILGKAVGFTSLLP
ncbi:MAG: helix-turn-helix domain-containing protein [Oscillospiraceae bacterium]